VQGEKNTACNVRTDCEPDKQERAIKEYETVLERLKTIPEADKDNYKRSIIERGRRSRTATTSRPPESGSPRTASRRATPCRSGSRKTGAVQARRSFVEKYNDATKRRDEARKRLDEKPHDESLRREWEAAREAMAEAQKKIEELDKQYGPDIEVHADKLIRHYQAEKTNHDTPSKQAEARLENCKKVNNMRYPSLPF
jgi:hypothetical protein